MAVMTSKGVLVVGPRDGLGARVAQALDGGEPSVTLVTDDELEGVDASAVDKLFQQHQPILLLHEVNLRESAVLQRDGQGRRDELRQRSHLFARACARYDCVAIHLSDYHVFGGDTKNAYDEVDQTAPLDSYGQWVADLEQQFATSLDRHLIVRFSWLIDAKGDNHFSRILAALMAGEELPLSAYRRGAPTWCADARRVLCGIVRQVMTGAENWGYFHYCSADSCNEWEFGSEVEATLAELREVNGKILADDRKDATGFPLEPASATLNSRRILNNFGVHGRSWRQGLKAQISHWLEQHPESEPARSSVS